MILTPLGYVFENVYEFAEEYIFELPKFAMKAPQGGTPTYSGPKPLISPYGPNYSMHPELSRPIHGIVGSKIASSVASAPMGGAVLLSAPPLVLFEMNKVVIEASPEEEQRGLWMMLASALTGTWGGDYSTVT